MDALNIRQEEPADYSAVYEVIKKAFVNAEHGDGKEQDLVVKLRHSKVFIPELSIVALYNNSIAGHILFTEALVNDTKVLALAPLSVLPLYQNMGIGMSLIKQGHKIAIELGYTHSVVLGYPEYYSKAGYTQACKYGIFPPFDVESENFMAICFDKKHSKLNGFIKYDKAFDL